MALHRLGSHLLDRWPHRPLDRGGQRHAIRSVRDQSPAMVGGSLMTYRIKPLSCDPAKIKGMSERLIVSHYENNYGGAVKRLNLIDEQLAELDYAKAAGFLINGLKREQLIAMNSMILHELFFDGLGDQSEPGAALREALARDFGSFERWRSEFVAMGKALGGGSGWVLLSWSPRDRKLVNQWASDHCHTLAGGTPILALDMTSTPITWTSAPRRRATSIRSWTSFAGTTWSGYSFKRQVVEGRRAIQGNELKPEGDHHACCSRARDLRRGDDWQRRQRPGDRLEEGR